MWQILSRIKEGEGHPVPNYLVLCLHHSNHTNNAFHTKASSRDPFNILNQISLLILTLLSHPIDLKVVSRHDVDDLEKYGKSN